MFQQREDIAEIISRHLSGTADSEQQRRLDEWLAASDENRTIFERVKAGMGDTLARYEHFRGRADFAAVKPASRVRRRRVAVAAAAAVLIPVLVFIGVMTGRRTDTAPGDIRHTPAVARLVMDDGRELDLSAEQAVPPHATLTEQNGLAVLSYAGQAQHSGDGGPILNRIVVPRGCDYRVELSDGTLVHLNAGSEIEFPVHFEGGTREVRLRGQAYFEVARDESQPFIVHTSHSDVRVLGTEFDVSDYEGFPLLTTLVRGSVSVTDRHGHSAVLTPGEQAELTGRGIEVAEVDTELFTAWKDGYFMFREAPLAEIMDRLSRWYDVGFVVEDPRVEEMRITAKLRKYDDINPVLDVLTTLNGLDFRTEGKTIVVYQSPPGGR